MTIGIPQALGYYYYRPMWTTFFDQLGCKVVTSGQTDRTKLDAGISIAPGETCLPLKCFLGHLLSLTPRTEYVFVPRLVCLSRQPGIRLGCPKMIGLPDMARALVPDAPILTVDIDVRQESEETTYVKLARRLGFPEKQAQHAYERGIACSHEEREERMTSAELNASSTGDLTIGLIGHAYLLDDDFLNLHIRKKIGETGARVISCRDTENENHGSLEKEINPLSWYFENPILSAAKHFYDDETISGIIYLCSFGCGAASITHEVIEFEIAPRHSTHFLKIVLDEHTGETGIMTRIESFVDMINLKREKKI
jgi:predicted nucleotide-binding protein (sugar kinase/HSP70/actin superfamily)